MNKFLLSLVALLAISTLEIDASQKNLKTNDRKKLAEAIKIEAYKFANNPSDYSLVISTEKLVWEMIQGTEGKSSCTIPSYDLTRSMEILNATFIKLSTQVDSYKGMPGMGNYKKQAVAQMESEINGQKAGLNKVLNNVIKYCI